MIVVDVETTGLDPIKNSLTAIGAIDFDNPEERFYEECRIWDGAEINPEALKVNGLTHEKLHDMSKKTESDIIKNFLDWCNERRDITLAGHNVHVDLGFLNAAIKRAGVKEAFPRRIFDQHSIVIYHQLRRGLTPPILDRRSAVQSDDVMKYVGIPTEPKPHIALSGALWEYEALYRLLYDKPGLEEFMQYKVPWAK